MLKVLWVVLAPMCSLCQAEYTQEFLSQLMKDLYECKLSNIDPSTPALLAKRNVFIWALASYYYVGGAPSCFTGKRHYDGFDFRDVSTYEHCIGTMGECDKKNKVCRCVAGVKGRTCTEFIQRPCAILAVLLRKCSTATASTGKIALQCGNPNMFPPTTTGIYLYDEGKLHYPRNLSRAELEELGEKYEDQFKIQEEKPQLITEKSHAASKAHARPTSSRPVSKAHEHPIAIGSVSEGELSKTMLSTPEMVTKLGDGFMKEESESKLDVSKAKENAFKKQEMSQTKCKAANIKLDLILFSLIPLVIKLKFWES